jgi:ABC-2 type transport system permease protein
MNIVLRELRANLKSLIIWCISMVLLIYVGMIKYSGIAAVGQDVNELFNQLPEAMKGILGMTSLDLSSISGYYGIFFLYFMLLGSIYAIMLGAVIISKEERDKTADFLLVKPVLRSKVITTKLIATLINLAIFNLVTLLASILFVAMFNKGEPINAQIIYLMIALFILEVLFASIGAGISVLAENTKKATSYATTLLLSMFILSAAIDIYDKISFMKYFTPFKYFPTAQIMSGSFDPWFLILSAVIMIACLVLTYITFQKRDIHI